MNLIRSLGLRTRLIFPAVVALAALCGRAASISTLFQEATQAYNTGDYARASDEFRQAAAVCPASGTLQNLGNAEWQQQRAGSAILAWEQALWLDPFNQAARQNLRFARKAAQIESPDLAWYEVVSSWLPPNWWAWTAGLCLWLAVGMAMLPGVLRLRRTAWQHAVAAVALTFFLLSVPAHIGVYTRANLGFITEKNTPLRLTPTRDAQTITRLAPGEPVRCSRVRGRYVFVRTSRISGWIEKSQARLVCSPKTSDGTL